MAFFGTRTPHWEFESSLAEVEAKLREGAQSNAITGILACRRQLNSPDPERALASKYSSNSI
jgi:hypothetical protein